MITLCIVACVGFQILIGDMFDVTKTTVGLPFHRKVGILAGRLRQSARWISVVKQLRGLVNTKNI